jgi:mitogen-activated protein kinase 15
MLESLPASKSKRLRDVFPAASDDALDLLKSLLQFNPNKRLTAEQALRHNYVAQFHNTDDEPICTRKIAIPIDDNQKFSIREYRNKLYSDIHKRKKELRKKTLQSHHNYYYNQNQGQPEPQKGNSSTS